MDTRNAPWAAVARSYVGWVPNIGSHLSFSMIGSGMGSGVLRITAPRSPIGRGVAVMQTRQTDDFLEARWYKRLVTPGVVQDWLLVGSTVPVAAPIGTMRESASEGVGGGSEIIRTATDEQGMLVGHVYALPQDPDPAVRRAEALTLGEIRRLFSEPLPSDGSAFDARVASIRAEVEWHLGSVAVVRFALMRTGELRVWYDDDVAGLTPADHFVVAKQAYYFVKDVVHRHVHHEPTSDQITPLVAFDATSEDTRRAGEEDWRRQTIWSLSREAEKQARRNRLDRLREALGIIAFADAFQCKLLQHVRSPAEPSRFEPNPSAYGFDFTHIRESLRIRVDKFGAQRAAVTPLLGALVAGAIAALALVSSFVGTWNGAIGAAVAAGAPSGRRPIDLMLPEVGLRFFAHNPLLAAPIVCAVLVVLFMVFLRDVILLPSYKPRQGIHALGIEAARRLGLSATWAFWFVRGTYVAIMVFEVFVLRLLLAELA